MDEEHLRGAAGERAAAPRDGQRGPAGGARVLEVAGCEAESPGGPGQLRPLQAHHRNPQMCTVQISQGE